MSRINYDANEAKELINENKILLAKPVTYLKAGTTRVKFVAPLDATTQKDFMARFTNYFKDPKTGKININPMVLVSCVILRHPDDDTQVNESAVRYLSMKPDALGPILTKLKTGKLLDDSGFVFDIIVTRNPGAANTFKGETQAEEFDATNVKWPALTLKEAALKQETDSYNWAYGIKTTTADSDSAEDDDLPF
jgi:hypothetical protein